MTPTNPRPLPKRREVSLNWGDIAIGIFMGNLATGIVAGGIIGLIILAVN